MISYVVKDKAMSNICIFQDTAPLCVDRLIQTLQPEDPVMCLRPGVVEHAAQCFLAHFPGHVLYAVKCNPDPRILKALLAGGVERFDVASLKEIEQVRAVAPQALLSFMNPVKSRPAIRKAYFEHGLRDFSLDSKEELHKILSETDHAKDLRLIIRMALPKGGAIHDLSGKFGANAALAAELLRSAKRAGARVGLCFHVGSQCLDPNAYELAILRAGEVIEASGVDIELLDIGGGFPVSYQDQTPPPLEDFMAAIRRGLAAINLPEGCELWSEPGRALVASGASLLVKVLLRRGLSLHINDGVYGTLADAGVLNTRFPVRLARPGRTSSAPLENFCFFGPTCDSTDKMEGPWPLPADVDEGDWIEIGQLGAYGAVLRTNFNGFEDFQYATVSDGPLIDTPGYGDLEDHKTSVPIFFFGSLMDMDLLELVLGYSPQKLTIRKGRILGFKRHRVAQETFPMLVPCPGGAVDGLAVTGLTEKDLQRIQYYETAIYELRAFDVECEGHRIGVRSFIGTHKLVDSGHAWDFTHWQVTEKAFTLEVVKRVMAYFGDKTIDEIEALWPDIEQDVARDMGRFCDSHDAVGCSLEGGAA